MNDRIPDDEEQSASDWLAAQFGAPQTPDAVPASTAPPVASVPPVVPTQPPVVQPPVVPPTQQAGPTQPPAGFSWGLRPGQAPTAPPAAAPPASVPPASALPPSSAAPVPPPLVEPAAARPTASASVPPAAPPASVPPAAPAPGSWDQPTQMMDVVDVPVPPTAPPASAPATPPAEPVAAEPVATELLGTELLGTAAIAHDAGTTSALESLFADENFRDYAAEPGPSQSPFVRAAAPAPRAASEPVERAPLPRAQKVLLGVAGGLVALLALVALFLLGTRLPALVDTPADAAPTASSDPEPSAGPPVAELPEGPVAPGVWAWDELLGGECLEPLDDIWAEEFTVVDCAAPHAGQLVFRGPVPPPGDGAAEGEPASEPVDPAAQPFPGTETLQAQLSLLCSAPGAIDLAEAGRYTDVQVSVSYPATSEQWDAGVRDYYCFVTRASGEPLTGSVAPSAAEDAAD